jgi:hypothetical protein
MLDAQATPTSGTAWTSGTGLASGTASTAGTAADLIGPGPDDAQPRRAEGADRQAITIAFRLGGRRSRLREDRGCDGLAVRPSPGGTRHGQQQEGR